MEKPFFFSIFSVIKAIFPGVLISRTSTVIISTDLTESMLLNKQNLKTLFEPHHTKMCIRGVSTRYDSNQPARLQKLARILKLWI